MIFSAIRSWLDRREAMQELSAVRRTEGERDVIRFEVLLERIESAMAADQHAAALRIWHEIQERFYSHAVGSGRLFKVILDLHRLDDAERLMRDGLARRPREQFYIVGLARVIELQGDIPGALEHWAIVRQKFPFLALGYAHTAACLVKAGRMEEAEAMLAQGIKQSYADVFCLIEHAKIAEARGNLEEALTRWQRLRDVQEDVRHPCYQNGTLGLAKCLRSMGRLDEAEALLRSFLERFGTQEVSVMELARIAEDRGDWAEAARRWARVKTSYPLLGAGYQGQIKALKKLGQTSAVDDVMVELMDRFPDALWAAQDYAVNALGSGDNEEIARRWTMVAERFPDCENAFRHGAAALCALGRNDDAASLLVKQQRRANA